MNEDYLWDKAGEPDPETAELERKLGRLRFQPSAHPLALPTSAPPARWFGRGFSQVLAIAAVFVILLLAGGLWLGLRGSIFSDRKLSPVADSGPRPPIGPVNPTTMAARPEIRQPEKSPSPGIERERFNSRVVAERRREFVAKRAIINLARVRRREQQLARQGEEAKAQLIRALHITSDALNTVQKKVRGEHEEERRPIS